MILSTGIDICDIRRIEQILKRTTGKRFMERYFTPGEREYVIKRPNPAAALARRWAAKEAIAKALGTGFRGGLHMHQMEVLNDQNGKPMMTLTGRARELQPANSVIHLAMTDEYPYAMAQVIISADSRG